LHGALRSHDADIDGALLPDPIIGEQRFILIDAGREAADEIRDEVDQSARAAFVEAIGIALAASL